MMAKWLKRVLLVVIVAVITIFVVQNYSWVFSKRIKGEVIEIERVTEPTAILSNRVTEEQIHSYAMAIRDEHGEIHTASGEDRQWSVVKKGYCVEAMFYRYPPWDLARAGTFFNARVLSMRDCGKGGGAPGAAGTTSPPASESSTPSQSNTEAQ